MADDYSPEMILRMKKFIVEALCFEVAINKLNRKRWREGKPLYPSYNSRYSPYPEFRKLREYVTWELGFQSGTEEWKELRIKANLELEKRGLLR